MTCSDGLSSWKCVNPVITCCDLSGWALVEYILFCNILWWIFYYFLLVVSRQSEEWCCRFLTLFHGCLVSYSALRDAYVNKSPIDFKSTPLSETKKHYLSYMLSYFLFDFCWIHFFGNEAWIIYVHHLASILIIINVLVKSYGGAGVAYAVAGLEFTNPYLQLRWFLRTHGYLNRPIHKITELWFMALFFIIRTIGGSVLVYYAVMQSDSDFGLKLSFLSIYGISLVLQWQILVYFRKKYLIPGNRAHVYLMQSRVSISPYFQRRTLDPPSLNDEYNSEESFSRTSPKTVEFAGLESNKAESRTSTSPVVGSPAVVSPKTESSGTRSPAAASLKTESSGAKSPAGASPAEASVKTESSGARSPAGASLKTESSGARSPAGASPAGASLKTESSGARSPAGALPAEASVKTESSGARSPAGASPAGTSLKTESSGARSPAGASSKTESPSVASPAPSSLKTETPGITSPAAASSPVTASLRTESPMVASPGASSIKTGSPGAMSPKSERSENLPNKKENHADSSSDGGESQKKQQNEE